MPASEAIEYCSVTFVCRAANSPSRALDWPSDAGGSNAQKHTLLLSAEVSVSPAATNSAGGCTLTTGSYNCRSRWLFICLVFHLVRYHFREVKSAIGKPSVFFNSQDGFF